MKVFLGYCHLRKTYMLFQTEDIPEFHKINTDVCWSSFSSDTFAYQ